MSSNLIKWPSGKEAPIGDVLYHVGEGWKDLITNLVDDLFKLGWDGELFQIKEKFGGLRFYIGAGSDEIYKRISEAENLSVKTCEYCGDPGEIGGKYWLKCLCPVHRKEEECRTTQFST